VVGCHPGYRVGWPAPNGRNSCCVFFTVYTRVIGCPLPSGVPFALWAGLLCDPRVPRRDQNPMGVCVSCAACLRPVAWPPQTTQGRAPCFARNGVPCYPRNRVRNPLLVAEARCICPDNRITVVIFRPSLTPALWNTLQGQPLLHRQGLESALVRIDSNPRKAIHMARAGRERGFHRTFKQLIAERAPVQGFVSTFTVPISTSTPGIRTRWTCPHWAAQI